jgi:hypothetical protein
LLFSHRAFTVAEKSDKSLNKHIKENLFNFEVPQIRTVSKKRTNLSLAKKVEAKVADFDIKGAVKLLSSDDSLVSFNEDVAEELKKSILHHLVNLLPNQAIQSQRNSFLRGFPLPFNVETLQAFGALFQIPQYYRKFLYCKTKMLCT